MPTGLRRTGDFCWTNMLTPRPAEAMPFFGRVLGWTFYEMPGMGHGARVGGRDVGGIFDLHGANTPPGLEPILGVMMKVEDVDAARARVVALGGTAKPAFDVGNQGRMAVCFDPAGAEFDVWEPKQFHGTQVDSALAGAPNWFEATTTDVARVTSFYADLFGWSPEVRPASGGDETVFHLGGSPIAGLIPIPAEMAGRRPFWTTAFTVANADEAARLAVEAGGTVHAPARDIPGLGRSCGIDSPQGVRFAAIAPIG